MLQVTLVIRAFAVRVFAYPLFFFSVMSSISILSSATVEAAARALSIARTVPPIHLTILTPGLQIKASRVVSETQRTCFIFSVSRVFMQLAIHRNSTPAHTERHLYVQYGFSMVTRARCFFISHSLLTVLSQTWKIGNVQSLLFINTQQWLL
jgi:hypothetical protein